MANFPDVVVGILDVIAVDRFCPALPKQRNLPAGYTRIPKVRGVLPRLVFKSRYNFRAGYWPSKLRYIYSTISPDLAHGYGCLVSRFGIIAANLKVCRVQNAQNMTPRK